MPASTRSSTKQARIDNPKEVNAPVTGSKRKASGEIESKEKKSKSAKSTSSANSKAPPKEEATPASNGDGGDAASSESIVINRAPVLELWAACVTAFLYPKLPWPTALSVGSAISTLCAISKGRAIGTIDPPDPNKADQKRRDRAERDDLEEVEVMGLHIQLKDGQALVSGKPKKASEETLKKKYGDDDYARVKKAFEGALKGWKGKEDELDHQAFHFYEVFRPTVPPGQKGWGRKGMLNIATFKSAVSAG